MIVQPLTPDLCQRPYEVHQKAAGGSTCLWHSAVWGATWCLWKGAMVPSPLHRFGFFVIQKELEHLVSANEPMASCFQKLNDDGCSHVTWPWPLQTVLHHCSTQLYPKAASHELPSTTPFPLRGAFISSFSLPGKTFSSVAFSLHLILSLLQSGF